MERLTSYFFDTYALVEMIVGNPNYNRFKEFFIITTKLNLIELHYALLRIYNKEIANNYYDFFIKFVKDIDDDTIKNANEFKFINKKRNLSYVDCIGYFTAKKFGIKFLTGDKEFENLEDVEFIK